MSDPTPSLYAPPQAQEPPEPPAPGLLDQIAGAFLEPRALFARMRKRPAWAPALLLTIFVGLAAMLVWAAKVDMAEATRHQMERTQEVFHVNIPDQAMDDAISKAEGKHPWGSAAAGAVLGTPLVYLVMALIIWGCASMATEENEDSPTFGQAFSLTAVQGLITLPAMFLAGLIALLRPVGGANIQRLMPTTLGFYLHSDTGWVRAVAALVDPLWLLSFFVLAVGMRQMLRTRTWGIGLCLGIFGLFGTVARVFGGLFQ